MHKNIVLMLCVVTLGLVTRIAAQPYEWAWAIQAGGIGNDDVYALVTDNQGNQYITGSFSGTITFGAISITSNVGTDLYVAKIDRTGNYLWVVSPGGTDFERGRGIAVDEDSNVYITGSFLGIASFGTTSLISSGLSYTDMFVSKLDTNGNWIWAVKAGGQLVDVGYDLVVDSMSNVCITGQFMGTAYFGSNILEGYGDNDIFVAKLDNNGNWLWAQKAGGPSTDEGNGIAVDANCNIYLSGYFKWACTVGSMSLNTNGNQYTDVLVAKIDSNGNWLWAKKAGGTYDDRAVDIALDTYSNVYIAGMFKNDAPFGSVYLQSNSYGDIFVAKLNTNGAWNWAVKAGSVWSDTVNGIAVDEYANLYLTGSLSEITNFGDITITPSADESITYLAKLDANANWLWATSSSGVGANGGISIAIDTSLNVCIAGTFQGIANFGLNMITYLGGNHDIYIAKYAIPYPVASFISNTTEGLYPLNVVFTDMSSPGAGEIMNWLWDFGDATTSHDQNPSHTYGTPGVYSVSLSVTNEYGLESTVIREDLITASDYIWDITLISSPTVNFYEVFVEEQSDCIAVKIMNSGTMDLIISDVHFNGDPEHFVVLSPFSNLVLCPGITDSLMVLFTPNSLGVLSDTLFIVNNSANAPILRISLSGTGLHVLPKTPLNLSIIMDGNDAYLQWEQVTQNLHDQVLVPDYYFIYIASDPIGDYTLMTLTPNTNHTHPYIGLGAERMFYRVTAVKLYRDDLSPLQLDSYLKTIITPGMTEMEVRSIVQRVNLH